MWQTLITAPKSSQIKVFFSQSDRLLPQARQLFALTHFNLNPKPSFNIQEPLTIVKNDTTALVGMKKNAFPKKTNNAK